MAYAVPTNWDHCTINNNVFAKHLQETYSKDKVISPPKHKIIIWSDQISCHVKQELLPLAMSTKLRLWKQCPDYKITDSSRQQKESKKYHNTCLKLHSNIPLMLTDNTGVGNQKANGTIGCLQSVKLKPA
jgi:hypothetical protein